MQNRWNSTTNDGKENHLQRLEIHARKEKNRPASLLKMCAEELRCENRTEGFSARQNVNDSV